MLRAIDCKLFNIDDSVNIVNSIVTLVSGAPEIDKQQMIGIKLESSGTPDHMDVVCRFRNHNSTRVIYDEVKQELLLDRFSHSEIYRTPEFHLVHH